MEILQTQSYSNRQSCPMSIAVIQPELDTVNAPVPTSCAETAQPLSLRSILRELAAIINQHRRCVDIVFEQHTRKRFVVICPDIPAETLQALLKSIGEATSSKLGVSLSTGVASFPDDALSFDEVVESATRKLSKQAPVPRPIPAFVTAPARALPAQLIAEQTSTSLLAREACC
jgi:hypothetical protein